MYHSEDVPHSSEVVGLASDTSGEQQVPNHSQVQQSPMPKVLKVDMAPAKKTFSEQNGSTQID
jgi:hypothetical protein